ncbi:MAG: tRNA 5-methoxyuridine(34)/uridine 5-oxyacetic acid(34) synthase CmoB [Verrucomicrobiota bacterium]|nr:tRNA 5-methoxyuridine(34)/uridine 5-oxyacetic acid(34) synthase CmoB [Verrucomicrobiota bacterium]
MDYLTKYSGLIDSKKIFDLREERKKWLDWKGNIRYKKGLELVSDIRAGNSDYSGDEVIIGKADELSCEQKNRLTEAIKIFSPWRKGPFNLFGTQIDSEWRSDLKMKRIFDFIEESEGENVFSGAKIADIGCNNGYYMYRLLSKNPELVIGLDPTMHVHYQYRFLNSLKPEEKIFGELLGIEHISYYREFFDVIFCMGILYHKPDPVGMLRDLYSALTPGGRLIIETQGIPGEEPVALFPEKRYAKAPGSYFIPTLKCLTNWIKRAKFSNIQTFYTHKMTFDEQRKTEWMQFQSLSDFLSKEDTNKTIEGYPAPMRFYLSVRKNK